MDSISLLKTKYGVMTIVENGKVTFSGLWIWTDSYRKAKGKCSVWNELQMLMKIAETEARA